MGYGMVEEIDLNLLGLLLKSVFVFAELVFC